MSEEPTPDEAKTILMLLQSPRLFEFPLTAERFADIRLGTGVDLSIPWAPVQRDGFPVPPTPRDAPATLASDPLRMTLRWFQAKSSFQQKMLSSIGVKIRAPFFSFGLSEQSEQEQSNATEDICLSYDVITHSERLPEADAARALANATNVRRTGTHYIEQLFYGLRIVAKIHGEEASSSNRYHFEMAVKVNAWFYSAEASVKKEIYSSHTHKNLEVQAVITGRLDPPEAGIVTSSDDLAQLVVSLRQQNVKIAPVPIFATLRRAASVNTGLEASFRSEIIAPLEQLSQA